MSLEDLLVKMEPREVKIIIILTLFPLIHIYINNLSSVVSVLYLSLEEEFQEEQERCSHCTEIVRLDFMTGYVFFW